jgi:hypothetical protein
MGRLQDYIQKPWVWPQVSSLILLANAAFNFSIHGINYDTFGNAFTSIVLIASIIFSTGLLTVATFMRYRIRNNKV